MSTGENANRLFGLFKSLSNPPFFLYRICHYLNRFVPYKLASYIYKRNKKDYEREGVSDYLLATFDGSGQFVHPDIAYFGGQYWLAVTPYPYGMEEYENPCIYQGYDLTHLKVPKGPIVKQHKHTQGIHLSDPCFAVNNGNLYCFYRESERKGDTEEQTVWGIQYSESNNCWSEPVLILNSVDDKILSPAILFDEKGELTVFYVSSLNDSYSLVSTKAEGVISNLTKQRILGAPDDYYLWHIGITRVKDIKKENSDSKQLAGLFLFKSRQEGGGMKLYETSNDGVDSKWIIVREVEMPEEIKDIVTFPYKSCYIPKQNGNILLSFRDKMSRNRMIILNNKLLQKND
jgi:hypothetical protein